MKKLTYVLSTLVVLLIISIFFINFDTNESSQDSPLTANAGVNVNSGNTVTYQLDLASFNNLVQNTPAFQSLPDDSVIVFSFFDGNGNLINGLDLTLKDKVISPGLDPNYDFRITTGIYYLDKINQVSDMCEFLNEIKNNQDARVERKISVAKASLKYKNMLQYKDCLGI